MPKQCYLIEDEVKFYFEGKGEGEGEGLEPLLCYKKNQQILEKTQAKVLKYMFEHNKDGVISTQAIMKAHWPTGTDKKNLLKLLFDLRNKFRALGIEQDGFIANGPNYLLTYQFELIDGLAHELKQMQAIKNRYRLFIFIAVLLVLAILILP